MKFATSSRTRELFGIFSVLDEVGASTVEELARVDGVVPDPDQRI